MSKLRVQPLTLKQCNEYIEAHHRHHKKVQGHRYSLGAYRDNRLVGVVSVGRPVARGCPAYSVAEVTRMCTNGERNVCSFLYGAAARVAKEMGFVSIQTYILDTEPGTSLRASGWTWLRDTAGGAWKHTGGKRNNNHPLNKKQCWSKQLSRVYPPDYDPII